MREKIEKSNYYLLLPLVMFLIAALFYWYEFVLRVSPSPMFSQLLKEFSIDATSFGYLSSSYFISYALLQLPAGLWTDKLGPRRLLTVAILLCAISTLLFALTNSFYLVVIARFFIGAGSAFAFVCCMKIVTIWFSPRVFPLLSGLTLTIGSLGAVSGVVLVSVILKYLSWRELMYAMAVLGFFLATLSWTLIRDENKNKTYSKHKETETSFKQCFNDVVHNKQNWLVALYGALITAPTDAIGGAWAVPFLEQVHSMNNLEASQAASMLFFGMAVGSPLLGYLSNRFKNRKYIMLFSSIIASLALLSFILSPYLDFTLASLLCFVAGIAGAYPMCFVVINDINDKKHIATAVGFVNMVCMLGSTILIAGMGIGLDFVSATLNLQVDVINRVYSAKAYYIVMLVAPIFYASAALFVIPFIKESYVQEKLDV